MSGYVTSEVQFKFTKIDTHVLERSIVDDAAIHMYEENDRSYFNAFVRFKSVVNSFETKVTMKIKGINNKTKQVFGVTLDGCKYLRGGYKSSFLNIFLIILQKYSSSKLLCPLKAVSFAQACIFI